MRPRWRSRWPPHPGHRRGWWSAARRWRPILRPEELRQLPDKQALVIAENARPIIARLHRCIEGRDGQRLLAQQRALREQLAANRQGVVDVETRTAAALVEAQRHGW
ncbi:hypothetical protein ET989_01315 [Propioniciclava sinopodophylli]|uniref:Uncharacterized protein n=1 Tax=Propioniciclava sinopodophylli TaxID=1837344 RepID=A0A4Q9KJ23_9ACTN|nr:hypothetical protein ET989_01315 [Propioniciclava sinopodophylli]